jgi:hypothetical protein
MSPKAVKNQPKNTLFLALKTGSLDFRLIWAHILKGDTHGSTAEKSG